jgi:hypothetical protein
LVHVICPISSSLSKYLDKWGLLDKGFAYDVVAVFGSQSTGKSRSTFLSLPCYICFREREKVERD